MNTLVRISLFSLLLLQNLYSNQASTSEPAQLAGTTIIIDTPLKPWQIKRKKYIDAYVKLGQNPQDQESISYIDTTLSEFEKAMWSKTPVEVMDLLQTFYVPQEGIKVMPQVIAEAILGYRDALQWASASGKAEIMNNDQFLLRALRAGSEKPLADQWFELIDTNYTEAKQIMEQGIQYARRIDSLKMRPDYYDRQWPTAFGLEQIMPELSNQPDHVKSAKPLMSDETAMEEAIKKISSYYLPDRLKPAQK